MVNSNNDDNIKDGTETGSASGPEPSDNAYLKGEDAPVDENAAARAEEAEARAESEAETTPLEASEAGEPEDDAASKDAARTTPIAPVAAKKKSGISGRVLAAILVVVALAGTMIWAQISPMSNRGELNSVKFDAKRMEFLVSELLPPQQQQALASNPEQKKTLVKTLKQILAVAQQAEKEGYGNRPEVQSKIAIQNDFALREAYEKKNPGVKISDEEINAYNQAHPEEFNKLIESEPQFKAQAQGPAAEQMKKEFGQIKVIAAKARAEKLDQDEGVKLKTLIGRSQALFQAYMKEQQNSPTLVTDADVDAYYNEHKGEFEEVRARHILFSTSPGGPGATDQKVMSKDEARKKAESVLERVKKGEDFSALAKQFSDDPGSKENGGLLAMDESGSDSSKYFGKGMMVPQFEQAAFSLKPGEVSGIVESDFGFHIIKVEDKRTAPLTEERIRTTISEKLKKEKLEKRIEEITAASNIEVAEDFTINPKPVEPQGLPGMPQGVAPPPGASAPPEQ